MREGEASRKGRRQVNSSRGREALFRAYYAPLYAFVRSQVESVEAAKDIAAAAFETVGEVPGRAPPLEPRVLLFTRARLAIDTVHQAGKSSRTRVVEEQGFELSPEERRIDACVRQLSRREQGVISLRFDGGLPCREIALVMGMTEVEVMVLVLRAVRRIKACLEARTSRKDAGKPRSVNSAP